MPKKNKRAKHNHHSTNHSTAQPSAGQLDGSALSHSEIWDDSALIRSWNDAVKEYEYYHSLHVQGIDVDAVLDAAEEAEANGEDVDLALPQEDSHVEVDTSLAQDAVEVEEAEDGEITEDDNTTQPSHLPATQEGGHAPQQHSIEREPTAQERQAALHRLGVLNGNSRETAVNGKEAVDVGTTKQAAAAAAVTNPGVNETLENVKMAYYWAGYYSGLYDQQRQQGTDHS